ncbi:MAG: tetratricopeptide repeat protein [Leptospirales bacterium]
MTPHIRKTVAGAILSLGLLLSMAACQTTPSGESLNLENESRTALREGHLKAAYRLTSLLVARFGPSPFALNQMALIQNRRKKPAEALRILSHAHRLYPSEEEITLNLAKIELYQGSPATARVTLLPLLAEKRWPEGFRTMMGRIDIETGQISEASIFLHEALRRHPDNPLVLANMGLLNERLGLAKKARQDFLKAEALASDGALRKHLLALLGTTAP